LLLCAGRKRKGPGALGLPSGAFQFVGVRGIAAQISGGLGRIAPEAGLGLLVLFGLGFLFFLQRVLEVLDPFSKAFCQFRDLLPAEEQDGDTQNDEQLR